jgi:hypothetical protein
MGDRETEVSRERIAREPVHFITPFLAAFPNPIVLRVGPALGTRQLSGTTVLSWWLRAARSADLYAYPPGGSERFLGTKTSDGWVRSGPIGVGETHKWKIFPQGNKTTPHDEEEVTASELDLPATTRWPRASSPRLSAS